MPLHRREFGAVLAVCIITALAYLPVISFGFLNWDDDIYLYQNTHLRALDLTFLKWAFTEYYAANWHPLTWLSHALDIRLWGLKPAGHHATSLLLHMTNAGLAALLALRLIRAAEEKGVLLSSNSPLIAAGMTGILFGIHPLHVESVAWVSERKDLLSAFFFLLSLITYLGYAVSPASGQGHVFTKKKYYLLCIISFVCALLSKPMAVTLPAILLLLDWYPLNRFQRKAMGCLIVEKLPFVTLSFISVAVTIAAQQQGGALSTFESLPPGIRLVVGIEALSAYLQKVFWPFALAPFYPYPKDMHLVSWQFLSSLLLVGGLTIGAVRSTRISKIPAALWGWYLITLSPVIGIVQVGSQAMADRYTYLPLFSVFLGLGLAAAGVMEKLKQFPLRAAAWSAALIMCGLFLFAATVNQMYIWKDSISLWDHELSLYPDVPVAFRNRGDARMQQGLPGEASKDFSRAIALEPSFAVAYNQRGIALVRLGDATRALDDFSSAIQLTARPEFSYFNNRGAVYARLGRYDEAIRDYSEALLLRPDAVEALKSRGMAYLRIGNTEAARKDFALAGSLPR